MAVIPRNEILGTQESVVEPEITEGDEPIAPVIDPSTKITSLEAKLEQLQELLGQNLRQPAAPAQQEYREPAIEDVTDEQLESSLTEGKAGVAKLIRTATNAAVERRVRGLEKQIQQLQQQGIETIGNLSERIAQSDMPYLEHPKLGPMIRRAHKEAMEFNPALRTDPRIYKKLHDVVVGENYKVLQGEAVEAALRKARDNPASSQPTDATGRVIPSTPDVPTPQQLLGAHVTLSTNDADSWAKTLGYKDWPAYVVVIQKQQEAQA